MFECVEGLLEVAEVVMAVSFREPISEMCGEVLEERAHDIKIMGRGRI